MNHITKISSPAKINLSLHIGKYSDEKKKHELQSEMMKISLADEIEIEVTEKKKIQIIVKGEYAKGVPNNDENIVYKAVKLFFSHRPRSIGLKITLIKNIPNGAGLGGGSSNAAEIIKFLHKYYSVPLKSSDYKIYADLGSDIPFFLGKEKIGIVSGVGEKIERIEKGRPQGYAPTEQQYIFGILFLFPEIKISTKWAFEQLKFLRENKKNIVKNIVRDVIKNNAKNNSDEKYQKYQKNIKNINNFQEMIFSYFFDIEKTFEEIQKFSPVLSGLSGTGSSCFAFFENEKVQEQVLEKFSETDEMRVLKF